MSTITSYTPGDQDKLGLALSGGGFRASLFHIGVLARLAELDLLKSVAVLSTVSGGSIIGAYYYLKVKQLLEGERPDLDGEANPYIQIVREIEVDFRAVVAEDLRTRTLLNPVTTGKMLLEHYSRSDRMAELYSRYLFAPLCKGRAPLLSEIKIQPKDAPAGRCDADDYNKDADHKIPVLILNAASLNTGRTWEFTGSWVGETPPDLEKQKRFPTGEPGLALPRLRFQPKPGEPPHSPELAAKLREITLGHAVAASACVPGIFQPLAIHNLYRHQGEEVVVQLVDGGVYDNQGLSTLIAAGCTHIIGSDASGQIEDEPAPLPKLLNVLGRSTNVSMARVREVTIDATYLRERGEKLARAAGQPSCLFGVQELAFFHMRQQFRPTSELPSFDPEGTCDRLAYHLSLLRTDLDVFSDVEAYALMYAGYGLCRENLLAEDGLSRGGVHKRDHGAWGFFAIREVLKPQAAKERRQVAAQLRIGRARVARSLLVGSMLAYLTVLAVVAAIGTGIYFAAPAQLPSWTGWLVASPLILVVYSLLGLDRVLHRQAAVRRIRQAMAIGLWLLLVPSVLWVVTVFVSLQLFVFNRVILHKGRLPVRAPGADRSAPHAQTTPSQAS